MQRADTLASQLKIESRQDNGNVTLETEQTKKGMDEMLGECLKSYREAVISRVWQMMTDIYGHKWLTNYGTPADSAFDTWEKGLSDMTAKQIAIGMNECLRRKDEWPPTLPAFRALCQPSHTGIWNAAAYQRNTEYLPPTGTKRLPDKRTIETRRDHARPFLQGLKAAVGNQRGGE